MPSTDIIELIRSQGSDYAKLLEDAAKQVATDLDAGLLRGLADVVRELPAEIERLQCEPTAGTALNRRIAAEYAGAAAELGQLRRKVAYAAEFLDGLADRMDLRSRAAEAADCRKMASKLRGETPDQGRGQA